MKGVFSLVKDLVKEVFGGNRKRKRGVRDSILGSQMQSISPPSIKPYYAYTEPLPALSLAALEATAGTASKAAAKGSDSFESLSSLQSPFDASMVDLEEAGKSDSSGSSEDGDRPPQKKRRQESSANEAFTLNNLLGFAPAGEKKSQDCLDQEIQYFSSSQRESPLLFPLPDEVQEESTTTITSTIITRNISICLRGDMAYRGLVLSEWLGMQAETEEEDELDQLFGPGTTNSKASPPTWESGFLPECMVTIKPAEEYLEIVWGPKERELVGGYVEWKMDELRACFIYQKLDYLSGKSMILLARRDPLQAMWASERLELLLVVIDLRLADNEEAVDALMTCSQGLADVTRQVFQAKDLHTRPEIPHLLDYIRRRKWEKTQ